MAETRASTCFTRPSGLHPVPLTRTQANPTCLSNSIGLRYPIVECRRLELLETFDVVEHVRLGFISGSVQLSCRSFGLERREEAFPSPHCPRRCPTGSSSRRCHGPPSKAGTAR